MYKKYKDNTHKKTHSAIERRTRPQSKEDTLFSVFFSLWLDSLKVAAVGDQLISN